MIIQITLLGQNVTADHFSVPANGTAKISENISLGNQMRLYCENAIPASPRITILSATFAQPSVTVLLAKPWLMFVAIAGTVIVIVFLILLRRRKPKGTELPKEKEKKSTATRDEDESSESEVRSY